MGEISGEETQWQPEPQLIEFEARGPEEFTVLGGEISGYFRIQNGVFFLGRGGIEISFDMGCLSRLTKILSLNGFQTC